MLYVAKSFKVANKYLVVKICGPIWGLIYTMRCNLVKPRVVAKLHLIIQWQLNLLKSVLGHNNLPRYISIIKTEFL